MSDHHGCDDSLDAWVDAQSVVDLQRASPTALQLGSLLDAYGVDLSDRRVREAVYGALAVVRTAHQATGSYRFALGGLLGTVTRAELNARELRSGGGK